MRPDGGGFMSGGGWTKRPRADQIIGRARSARLAASHIAAAPRARARQDGDDDMEASPGTCRFSCCAAWKRPQRNTCPSCSTTCGSLRRRVRCSRPSPARVAELTLENRLVKKSVTADAGL
jgi:hypothetical protein